MFSLDINLFQTYIVHMMKPKTIHIIVLIALCCVIYANSLQCSFHFDDFRNIVENESIHNLSPKEIWDVGYHQQSRFLGYLSFAVSYALGGENVIGYHIVSILLHIAASVLVYYLAGLLFGNATLGFVAALIFAAHPIQTQAVTYIVQRFALMSAVCYLAALYLFLKKRYWLMALMMICGVFSKETFYTIPLAILLIRKPSRRTVFICAALVVILAIFVTAIWGILLPFRAEPSDNDTESLIDSTHYAYTQVEVVSRYIRLILVPLGQTLDPDIPMARRLPPLIIPILALLFVAYAVRRLHPVTTFGILFFFIALLVESSFMPLRNVMQEHRLYLPMFGAALVFADYVRSKKVVYPIVAILCLLTMHRNTVWKDEVSLWTDVVQKAPNKSRGHSNLGVAFMREGRYDDARICFENAYRIAPYRAESAHNLGTYYLYSQESEKALRYLKRAVVLDSTDTDAIMAIKTLSGE